MMTEIPILRHPVVLAAEAQAKTLLELDGTPPSIGELAFPLYTDGASGELVSVTLLGIVPAIAGGAITPGDKVMASGVEGKCIVLAGASRTQVGWAMTAAAADGDEFLLLVLPHSH